MKRYYSVEVDKSDATALAYCLKKMEDEIPDFGFDWHITINAGGIDYGIYLNIDIKEKEIEICNCPTHDCEGDDYLDDVLENFNDDEEE